MNGSSRDKNYTTRYGASSHEMRKLKLRVEDYLHENCNEVCSYLPYT